MNILHLSRTMNQGGAEKVVYQLCSGTNDIFDNIVVASCGGVYVKKLNSIKVKHYNIPDMDRKDLISIIIILIKILIIVRKEKIDVIHSHHRMASFYSLLVSTIFPRLRRIYTSHNIFNDKKKLTSFSLKGSEIVAVGNDVRKNLVNTYNVNDTNIHVIYNSIDMTTTFGKWNIELNSLKKNGCYLVGNIGRISKQKGMEYFVQAIGNVKKTIPKIKGIIIGDGEQRKNLEKLIFKLDLEEDIVLLGYQDNVLDIINQLDFVVLSSLWEGFPLTPVETFSVGKTIIATDINGTNEIVEDFYNGLLVPVQDINKLTDAIIELCTNLNLRGRLEKNAKLTYDEKYSYKKFLNMYKELYKNRRRL